MEGILTIFVFIVGIIVITSIINEKILHIEQNIALVMFSFLFSIVAIVISKIGFINFDERLLNVIKNSNLDSFLLEFSLCFMLFAGASKIHLNKVVKNMIPIAALSIIATLISSIFYGFLFYIISLLFKMNLNIWICMLLGILVSPTDPISATSILNKLGLSKSVISVIEGEAMFNDGIAVALFVFVKSIILNGSTENIILLLLKEIFGATIVALIVSFLFFKLVKHSNEPMIHILISLLDVSLCYVLCEYLGFSGVIASVVCGMYFSYQNKKIERWKAVVDSKELYNDFWEIIEHLLNNVLFVLVGLSLLSIELNKIVFILIPLAIALNLITRYVGVRTAIFLIGKKNIPGKYNLGEFSKLLTWSGLKGGLSLALAFTTKEFLLSNEYQLIINVVMITILFTTIVQGLIVSKVYEGIEKKREKNIEKSLRIV